MEFRVLGPLEVRSGRDLLTLGGPKPRAVLADLLVHAGSVVSTDRLIDDLWAGEPPAAAKPIVQNAISHLRKALGHATIERVAPGYLLAVDPGSIDAHRFQRLVRDARPLPAEERVVALRNALALWRGPPFMELAFEAFLQGEIGRLDELRLTALEDRIEAELELGLHERVVSELDALVLREPTRERLVRLQMLALHRSGRTQHALDAYSLARRAIDEQSGLEPAAETKALQRMILTDETTAIAVQPPTRPGAYRRSVAIVVSEVTVEAGVDLEAAAATVTASRDALEEAVLRHGGMVTSGLGYESIAVFGAEMGHEDDVLRAGRAAIETREIVQSRALAVRFAIGVGRLLVEDGSPVLLGPVLDDARRAVADASPGDVVVTPAAARLGAGAFQLRSRRGSEQLVSVRSGRSEALGIAPPLVGREDELARLHTAFLSAVATSASAHLLVVGEAGLGKTRLVREFTQAVDAVVLRTACVPYGEGITFLPLRDLADQAASLDGAAPTILDVSSADAAFASVGALIDHFLESRPVVLVLDDLHWAVPTFLDLVEYLVVACTGPLLVVCAARPQLFAQRPSWQARALQLEPISATDTRRLIEGHPAAAELEPDVVAAIADTADGFPLFAEQLVAFARESPDAESSIPPSLDAVLTSRLDRLPQGERAVLQRAAVLGARFDRASLAALAGGDGAGLDARLEALERAGLVRADAEDRFGFGHALVRDAAYDGATKAERVSLHEMAARHADLQGGDDVSAGAVHLEAAAQLARASGSRRPSLEAEAGQRLAEAGLAQWRGGDAAGAANLLERARLMLAHDEPLRLDVLVELGLALRDSGDRDRAVAVFEEARDAARRTRRRRLALRVQVESIIPGTSTATWDDAEADAILQQALPTFRRARDDRALGRALLVRAYLSSVGCHFAAAEVAAEDALTALARAGYSPSRALLVLAAAALHGPRSMTDARDHCAEVHRRAAGHSLAQANVDLIRSSIETLAGDARRARELLAGAKAVFEERGQRLLLRSECAGIEAEIEILSGDLERAAAVLEGAAAELESRGETARAARHHAVRAEVAFLRADPVRAAMLARRAARRTPQADLHGKVTCMRIAGKALAMTQSGPAGRRLVEQALSALDGTDALELRCRVLLDLAEVERVAGRRTGLLSALEHASDAASAKGSVLAGRRIDELRDELERDEAPEGVPPGPA